MYKIYTIGFSRCFELDTTTDSREKAAREILKLLQMRAIIMVKKNDKPVMFSRTSGQIYD